MNRQRHTIVIALLVLAFAAFIASCSKKEAPATATTESTATSNTTGSSAEDKATPPKATIPPPTVVEAKALLESSPDVSDYEFTLASVSLPAKKSALTPVTSGPAEDLVKAGWLRFKGDDIVLTGKAKNDKRFIVRPSGDIDVVPLAKKELLSVDAVGHTPEGEPTIEFTWHWIPNDVGKAFQGAIADRFAATNHARATLLEDSGHWIILNIQKVDAPEKTE